VVKKEFPKVHFYDQDIVDLYNQTWNWIKNSWKHGTKKNGLGAKYFNYPKSDSINQFEACVSTFFLVYCNKHFPVTPLLDNFYAKQEATGAIYGEYSEENGKPITLKKNPLGVHPPLFSWAEFNIYHKIGSKKRIKEIIPKLDLYYLWLENKFKRENGLYSVPLLATIMENAPRNEMEYPIDFNAQQALNALYMSLLYDILNDKEKSYRYKRYYFSLKTRINSMMWHRDDHMYYDLDKKGKQIRTKTIASFWPLLARVPNEERAEKLIAHLTNPKEFGLDNPFPSLAASNKHFDRSGYGFRGSVFPPFTYMVIKGLEEYGRFDLARECAIRHLYYILDSVHPTDNTPGTLWEAYCPVKEGKAKWPKKDNFPRDLFLPYAALSTIALIIENVIGLSISLPRKTVDWIIPTLEIMGIEDLSLKRNLITILSNKSSRGWEIKLESEKLYYFTVNIIGQKKKTLPIPSGKCSILIDKI
jgi:neutral trehalase